MRLKKLSSLAGRRRSQSREGTPLDPAGRQPGGRDGGAAGTPMRKRRVGFGALPTLLTLGNGMCGLIAMAVVISEHLQWDDYTRLRVGGLLIFAGMVFDALDGHAARMMRQTSPLGAQLDSLCDLITFGVAPAVILWHFQAALPHRVVFIVGALFALSVTLRLARFNAELAEDDPHEGFQGLPSPAAAGVIGAIAIAMPQAKDLAGPGYHRWIQGLGQGFLDGSQFIVPAVALVLAYLMVSRVRYPHFMHQWVRKGRLSPFQIGQLLFALAIIGIVHELALPLLLGYYALESPVRQIWNRWRGSTTRPQATSAATESGASVED
jgi:CDP-diacylglycerol---serine O-phosphatidyltransferase